MADMLVVCCEAGLSELGDSLMASLHQQWASGIIEAVPYHIVDDIAFRMNCVQRSRGMNLQQRPTAVFIMYCQLAACCSP